ncbi:MAG: beta-ketoacyl-ACP synthase II [Acetanaerobacterium sp.]
MKRVVITGIGALTSLGADTHAFWESIKAGRHGISNIEGFDTTEFAVKLGAEIKDFSPTDYGIEKKEARRMDRYCQFAVAAAGMAIADCGTRFENDDPFRIGVTVSSGIGGMKTNSDENRKLVEKGPKRISPFYVPMIIANMAAGMVSIRYGFKGSATCIVTACATSADSVGSAFRSIKHGYHDVMIAGGAEAAIIPISVAGFHNMMALSTSHDPDRASIPFDKARDGFVMGDGAGVLVLEEYEHAKKRGAKIYAEVTGYGSTADAYHITSPDPDGEGAAQSMRLAMQESELSPADIGYINAHGTSTSLNDKYETVAIKKALGDCAYNTPISSTKSMTGHLLGGAGAVEAIVCALALRDGVIPPTVGYREKDEECDLDYVTEGVRHADIKTALSNSLGFGGHNATLCLKRYEEGDLSIPRNNP